MMKLSRVGVTSLQPGQSPHSTSPSMQTSQMHLKVEVEVEVEEQVYLSGAPAGRVGQQAQGEQHGREALGRKYVLVAKKKLQITDNAEGDGG